MSDLSNILKLLGEAWEVIGHHVKNERVDDAAAALDAIQRVWETIEDVKGGRITPDDARAELEALRSLIERNDEAADAAVTRRFRGD